METVKNMVTLEFVKHLGKLVEISKKLLPNVESTFEIEDVIELYGLLCVFKCLLNLNDSANVKITENITDQFNKIIEQVIVIVNTNEFIGNGESYVNIRKKIMEILNDFHYR
jgi:hypothetical protein